MAQETDKLVEQLKQMTDLFKGMEQHIKNMTKELGQAVRPMEKVKEEAQKTDDIVEKTVKKVKEITKEQEELNKKISEEKLARAQALTEKAELQAEQLRQEIESNTQWAKKTAEWEKQNEAARSNRGFVESLAQSAERYHQALAVGVHRWDEMERKMVEVQKASPAAAKLLSGGSELFTGHANVGGAVQSIGKSVLDLLPTMGGVGGIIGMMIYGKYQEAEWSAIGNRVASQFDVIGGHTREFAAEMGGMSRSLSKWGMAGEKDLETVAHAFREVGFSQKDARQQIEGFSSAAGGSLMAATLGMDKALRLAEGTTAKFVGTLAQGFNMEGPKAFETLMKMKQAAQESGANINVFMQQTMEAASSLRFMTENVSALGAAQGHLGSKYQGLGMGKQTANEYAAQGMSGLAGMAGNMDIGLGSIIARNMGLGGESAFSAYHQLVSPTAQKEAGVKMDPGQMFLEMQRVLPGNNKDDKWFAAMQLFGGDKAAADALVNLTKEDLESGKVSAKDLADISGGFKSEAERQNRIAKDLEVIKDAVAKVSVGLLGMIVDALKALINVVMYVGAKITGDTARAGFFEELLGQNAKSMGGHATQMGAAVKQLGGGLGEMAGQFFGTQGTMWDPSQAHKLAGINAQTRLDPDIAAEKDKWWIPEAVLRAKQKHRNELYGGGIPSDNFVMKTQDGGHLEISATYRAYDAGKEFGAK